MYKRIYTFFILFYRYKIIAKHFGDFLYSKIDYKQAALMYNRSTERNKAIGAYLKVGLWKESLELSYELRFK